HYTRNAIRKYVVPHLKRENENLHTTVQRLSESLQEDEQYLTAQAKKVLAETVFLHPTKRKVEIDCARLKAHPLALQRRVYRLVLDYLYDSLPKRLTYAHEAIFLQLVTREGNRTTHFPEELIMERSYNTVTCFFMERDAETKAFHQVISDFPTEIS